MKNWSIKIEERDYRAMILDRKMINGELNHKSRHPFTARAPFITLGALLRFELENNEVA